jgi:hypothetical protein
MKKIISTTLIFLSPLTILACEVCQNRQPKALQGITHGTGAQNYGDYWIIASAILIVLVTLFLSVKFLLKPNENEPNHIKNSVCND